MRGTQAPHVMAAAFAAAILLAIGCDRKAADTSLASIAIMGTGDITGLYFSTGGAICRVMNKDVDGKGLKYTVEPTAGSVENIKALSEPEGLRLGLAQSDAAYQAWSGSGEYKASGAVKDLRSLFSLYDEAVTIVATVASGIRAPRDLKGRKVWIGAAGSGTLSNAVDVLDAFGLGMDDLLVVFAKPKDVPRMLENGEIEAFFFTVGHPNKNTMLASAGPLQIRLVEISGPEVDDLLAKKPYYVRTRIPTSFYPSLESKEPVASIGVKATLVASASADPATIYLLTKTVVENLDNLKAEYPAFQSVSKERMLDGLTVPLHPGAERYFKEIGISPSKPWK